VITNEEIQYIFSDLTTERRNVEFKQSMDWNEDHTKLTVTKSILAFSNTRDGGYLTIGVNKVNNHYTAQGMTPEHLESFENFDNVLQWINARAEPPVTVERRVYTDNGHNFLIFKISDFDRYPIVCKQGGGGVLNKGVIYVRTSVMPQSAPCDNQTNLNEIVEMILDKHTEELSRRFRSLLPSPAYGDEEPFDQEMGDL
jgi:predicted HTH transcriptional regulator